MDHGVLVVTGGGQGIGAQVALRAAQAGTPVAILSRSNSGVRIADRIKAAGGRALAIAADVGKEADVVRAFRTIDEFGSLGGLVNNAVLAGPMARLAELNTEALELVFHTNVFGAFFCAREAARRLSTRNGGSGGGIISMSSTLAMKTGAPGAWVHFSASKAALEMMSFGLARELGPEGVRVNTVRCGVIATETRLSQDKDFKDRALALVPLGRMAEPAEVADVVLWLLSPSASYVNGATIDVSGGM
jgi:NAD(P)-dependent dehydrogenase (short-subunit alcohol dehydrogenase family)